MLLLRNVAEIFNDAITWIIERKQLQVYGLIRLWKKSKANLIKKLN